MSKLPHTPPARSPGQSGRQSQAERFRLVGVGLGNLPDLEEGAEPSLLSFAKSIGRPTRRQPVYRERYRGYGRTTADTEVGVSQITATSQLPTIQPQLAKRQPSGSRDALASCWKLLRAGSRQIPGLGQDQISRAVVDCVSRAVEVPEHRGLPRHTRTSHQAARGAPHAPTAEAHGTPHMRTQPSL